MTLERPVRTDDDSGGGVIAYVPVASLWGAVTVTGGDVTRAGDALQGETRTRIVIRHRDDIAPLMRLVDGVEAHVILWIQPKGRRRLLQLACRRERAG
jgi:SPP1 family predicted phage head-tail adaptor